MTCLPIWTQLASGPKDSGKPTMVDFLHTQPAIPCLPFLNTFVHFFTQQTLSHPPTCASVTHYANLSSCSTPLKLFMRLLPARAKIFKYRKNLTPLFITFHIVLIILLSTLHMHSPNKSSSFQKAGWCFLSLFPHFLSLFPHAQHVTYVWIYLSICSTNPY